jgi:hypothetical protein
LRKNPYKFVEGEGVIKTSTDSSRIFNYSKDSMSRLV